MFLSIKGIYIDCVRLGQFINVLLYFTCGIKANDAVAVVFNFMKSIRLFLSFVNIDMKSN